MIKLNQGDCLQKMDKLIKSGIIVDVIITDPPYGTTACKWDSVIPFEPMWERLNKLIKPNGAIVLFGSEPFSSALRMSNIKNYKYDWIWEKSHTANFTLAKFMPLKNHENISVFYSKKVMYHPQMVVGSYKDKRSGKPIGQRKKEIFLGQSKPMILENIKSNLDYPKTIQFFKSGARCKSVHPTQKPVPLIEYLIKTYTNEDETVLDFTMGSGTTGVACLNTNRNFIGIELDKEYFKIAEKRIEQTRRKIKRSIFNLK